MVSLLIIPLYMELWWLNLDSLHRRTLPTWINLRTCDLIGAILRTVTSLMTLIFVFLFSCSFSVSYTCCGHSVCKESWVDVSSTALQADAPYTKGQKESSLCSMQTEACHKNSIEKKNYYEKDLINDHIYIWVVQDFPHRQKFEKQTSFHDTLTKIK